MKRVLTVLLAAALILSLAACGGQTQTTTAARDATAATTVGTKEMVRVSLGTGSIGANLYLSGTAMANMLNKYIDNFEMSVEVTAGSQGNTGLVGTKELLFGIATDSTLYQGYTGTGWSEGTAYTNLRAILPVNPSAVELLTNADSNVYTAADYATARVSFGPTASNALVVANEMKAVGVFDWSNKSDMGWSDVMTAMGDGLLDAVMDMGGFPSSARAEYATTHDVRWITFTDEELQKVVDTYPYYYIGYEPAGTYAHMDEDYKTIMVYGEMFCDQDVDADLVYEICKQAYEHADELVAAASSYKYMLKEAVQYISMPFHEGAIRYFEEQGIQLPDSAYSTR